MQTSQQYLDIHNKNSRVFNKTNHFYGMILKTLDTNHLHEIYRRFLKRDKKYPTCTIVRHKILQIKVHMLGCSNAGQKT